jgi:hypothetical protein
LNNQHTVSGPTVFGQDRSDSADALLQPLVGQVKLVATIIG